MAKYGLPSPTVMRQLLTYDKETGKFFWLPRYVGYAGCRMTSEKACDSWNEENAGNEAFTGIDGQGYFQGCVLGYRVKPHRAAIAMVTGHWPTDQVDHINRNKLDNRFCNLREATIKQNCRNVGSRGGVSRHRGVQWRTSRNCWVAVIYADGKKYQKAGFRSEDEAAVAYNKLAILHHGSFAGLNVI